MSSLSPSSNPSARREHRYNAMMGSDGVYLLPADDPILNTPRNPRPTRALLNDRAGSPERIERLVRMQTPSPEKSNNNSNDAHHYYDGNNTGFRDVEEVESVVGDTTNEERAAASTTINAVFRGQTLRCGDALVCYICSQTILGGGNNNKKKDGSYYDEHVAECRARMRNTFHLLRQFPRCGLLQMSSGAPEGIDRDKQRAQYNLVALASAARNASVMCRGCGHRFDWQDMLEHMARCTDEAFTLHGARLLGHQRPDDEVVRDYANNPTREGEIDRWDSFVV